MDKWNTWHFYKLYMTLTKLGTEHKNEAGVCCNIGDLYEINLKLTSREISLINNTHFICLIVLIFCTEDGSDTAVLCTKSQNEWTIEKYIRDRRYVCVIWVKMSFGDILHYKNPCVQQIACIIYGIYDMHQKT